MMIRRRRRSGAEIEVGNQTERRNSQIVTMMTSNIPRRKCHLTTRSSLVLVVTTILLESIVIIQGQFIFPPSTEPCPSNSDIIGYTTIAAMNTDMQTEIDRIDAGGEFDPDRTYQMVLCPSTTFDTSTDILRPSLNGANFICGENGNVADGCIVSGGTENINIQPSTVDNYDFEMIAFQGVTFEQFTDRSVNNEANSETNIEFSNSIWQNFLSDQVFRTTSGTITVRDSTISGENGGATARTVFSNEGGTIVVNGLTVEDITVEESRDVGGALFLTTGGGTTNILETTISDSEIEFVADTQDGTTDVSGVQISNIEEARSLFLVSGDSNLNFLNVDIIGNSGRNMNFQVVRARDSANVIISNSTFQNNMNIQHVLNAESDEENPTNPSIVVSDSDFIGNVQNNQGTVVISEFPGARVEVTRVNFIENTGGRTEIGGYFGGYIEFTATCFFRGNNFIVAFVSEESDYVAFNNYVEDAVSPICGGIDPTEGGGRLAVELDLGRLCFQPGATDDCLVDCTNEANDLERCIADERQEMPSVSNAPSISFQPSVSLMPSVNQGPEPTESSAPSVSNAPSVSLQPSIDEGPAPTVSSAPSISNAPSISFQPSVSNAPSMDDTFPPSTSQRPSISMTPSTSQPLESSMPTPTDTQLPSISFMPSVSFIPTRIGPTENPTAQQTVEITASPAESIFPSISFMPSFGGAPPVRLNREPLFSDIRPSSDDDPHDLDDDDDGKGKGKGFQKKRAKRFKRSKKARGEGFGKGIGKGKGNNNGYGKGKGKASTKTKTAKKKVYVIGSESSGSTSSSGTSSSSSSHKSSDGKGGTIWNRPTYDRNEHGGYMSSIGFGAKSSEADNSMWERPRSESSSDETFFGIGWNTQTRADDTQQAEFVEAETKWHGERFSGGDKDDE